MKMRKIYTYSLASLTSALLAYPLWLFTDAIGFVLGSLLYTLIITVAYWRFSIDIVNAIIFGFFIGINVVIGIEIAEANNPATFPGLVLFGISSILFVLTVLGLIVGQWFKKLLISTGK